MDTLGSIEEYWDVDARTYDAVPGHGAGSPAERAAWAAALARHLPAAPARVLDVGAGTGFLSLAAARLGHDVTALDVSAGMLAKLAESARRERVDVRIVHGPATEPPDGVFDVVMERHLLWTLPDPAAALRAWRVAAPAGRLVVLESLWGGTDPVEALRVRARSALRRALRRPPGHHAPYDAAVLAALPLGGGTPPAAVVEQVETAGWGAARLERLHDVEWARLLGLPAWERLLGVTPQYLVRAGG